MVRDIIRDELADIQKTIKRSAKRRSLLLKAKCNMEDLIANEQVIITISQDDYIKRMPIDTFREQSAAAAKGLRACS